MKITLLTICAALTFLVVGCERPSTPAAANGTIALLDLDVLAKRLGRDVAIEEQLKAKNADLEEQLTGERGKLQTLLDESQQKIGDAPTDEQKQQLAQLGQSLTTEFQTKLQQAREELNTKQIDLVRQFREEVKPVAQKVASGKGMNTVLLRSDIVVLSADPAIDITDAVVAEMISAGKGSEKPAASPTATP